MSLQKLSKMFASCSRTAMFNIMARNITTAVDRTPPDSKSISFLCQDQQVKVGKTIYHLDRFRSSLKSNYFEKLFTSGEFEQKTDKILEIQPKNSDLFPVIVDLLHEKKLFNFLDKDNYIALLEAMDNLEVEIDLEIVSKFIDQNLTSLSLEDAKLFELYRFIRKNTKFEYLLSSVFKCMSGHLTTVQNHEIFPSLPLGHLIQLITSVENPDDKKRYEIVQMCAEWLCLDMENRFPHMVILINSIKPGFHSKKKSDDEENKFSKSLPKTDIDEQAKRKTMVNCVYSLLAFGGKLNPSLLSNQERSNVEFNEYDSYDSDRDSCSDESEDEYEEYEQKYFTERFVHKSDKKAKLKKYFENGDFYDITVRVGENPYKLHRAVLESKSDYFADLFRTEYAEVMAQDDRIPSCPSKDKEYSFYEFDQSAFDAVINYIYFDEEIEFSFDIIPRIFNIADILKIEKLLKGLKEWLDWRYEEAKSQDVIEMLNLTHENVKHNDLYSTFLCKHLTEQWPKIYDVSKFCSISWPVLKTTLKSLNSPNFCFDDPNKILDICSTWIIHDVENRYRLLPKIAKAINPHCVPNYEKYAAENAVLDDYSKQSIRDELWEILSAIEYLTSSCSIPTNSSENPDDIPVFVAIRDDGHIDVLNADLDKITTPGFSAFSNIAWRGWLSTTMIGDNLFLFLKSYHFLSFLVYNFRLKKRFTLPYDITLRTWGMHTLLNCNNEIYFCSKDGSVMAKYSMQLGQWMIMAQKSPSEGWKSVQFASDGKNLYRSRQVSEKYPYSEWVIDTYNFEKSLWTLVPNLPPIKSSEIHGPQQLTVINDGDLAVTFESNIVIFDRNSKMWCYCKIPKNVGKYFFEFIQHKDRLLLMADRKLYHVSLPTGVWKLKKELGSTDRYDIITPINQN